jgi:hypothetical protein
MNMFGEQAGEMAARRANAMLDQGDLEGFQAWQRIHTAIRDLKLKVSSVEDDLF